MQDVFTQKLDSLMFKGIRGYEIWCVWNYEYAPFIHTLEFYFYSCPIFGATIVILNQNIYNGCTNLYCPQ